MEQAQYKNQQAAESMLPLFNQTIIQPVQGTVRTTDPITSDMAAATLKADRSLHRWRALEALAKHGPSTDFQLADYTKLQQNSIGKRRKELCDKKLAEDSGKKGKSTTGSAAIIWQLTELGYQHYTKGLKI